MSNMKPGLLAWGASQKPPRLKTVHVPALGTVNLVSPSSTFLDLVQWTIPHPYERKYYDKVLSGLGWKWDNGVYRLEIHSDPEDAATACLFMAHLDTVTVLPRKIPLRVRHGLVDSPGAILGGDDRCGVALILYLAHKIRLPGRYLLTTGEECGCLGFRSFLDASNPDVFSDISLCISLDRKGTTDIVTHQLGDELATPTYALVLADLLAEQGMRYEPSPEGLFTDSYELAGLPIQVVNLSVGYYDAHSKQESVDLHHLDRLGVALANLDYQALVACAEQENELQAHDSAYEGIPDNDVLWSWSWKGEDDAI